MVASSTVRIRQRLFDARGPHGEKFGFAVLDDERCAITRDDEVIEVCDSDPQSIDRAVKNFLRAVRQLEPVGARN